MTIIPKLTDFPRAEEFRLDSLLIHKQTTHCLHCSHDSTTSLVFEVWIAKSPFSASVTRRLIPAVSLRSPYPIGLSELKPKTIPVCHQCYTSIPTAQPLPMDESEWRNALLHKYSPTPSGGIAKTTTKLPITHDLSTAHVGRSPTKQTKSKLPAPTLDQL